MATSFYYILYIISSIATCGAAATLIPPGGFNVAVVIGVYLGSVCGVSLGKINKQTQLLAVDAIYYNATAVYAVCNVNLKVFPSISVVFLQLKSGCRFKVISFADALTYLDHKQQQLK